MAYSLLMCITFDSRYDSRLLLKKMTRKRKE